MDLQFEREDAALAVEMEERTCHEDRGEDLGSNGCDRDACNSKTDSGHENEIQNNVQNTGKCQVVERTLRVALSDDDRASEGVDHEERTAQHVDAKVQCRLTDRVGSRAHPLEESTCKQAAEDAGENTEDDTERKDRMGQVMDLFFLVRAEDGSENDSRAKRDTDEQVDHEVNERRAGSDSGDGSVIDELSDHDDIGCVKEQLKDLRHNDRQAVADERHKNATVDHVHVVASSEA